MLNQLNANSKTFAQDFTTAVERSGIEDQALAEYCGITLQSLRKYRLGTIPKNDVLVLINDALDDGNGIYLLDPRTVMLKDATLEEMFTEISLRCDR